MARRKRMQFEPQGTSKRRRRPAQATPRADQVSLSRRLLLMRSAVGAAFVALGGKLGYMQLVERKYYEDQADANIREEQRAKAPRGLFFDAAGRLLADNRRAWAVKVTPAQLPEEGTPARRWVLDQLIAELSLPDVLVIDPTRIPRGQEDWIYREVAALLGEEDLDEAVRNLEFRAEINYLVLLRPFDPALSVDEAAYFRAESRKLPGLQVMNLIDYQLGNAGDPRHSIMIRNDVPREIALRLENNRLYLPGVELDDNVMVRRYHAGQTMSHLLGFARPITAEAMEATKDENGITPYELDDIIGEDGLELELEDRLRGRKGFRIIYQDTHGVEARELPGSTEPEPGQSFKLTVDLEMQAAASDALAKGIAFSNADREAKHRDDPGRYPKLMTKARSGSVVALNPKNGEVLALVSYPHFDNQLFVDGITTRKYNEYIDKEKGEPLFNRAIAGYFPPGSTIKPFLAASALHDGKITPETTFNCTGGIKIPFEFDVSKGNVHPCWLVDGGHSDLNVTNAIAQSCDVFFYNVGVPEQKYEDGSDSLNYYDYFKATNSTGEKHYFVGMGVERMEDLLTDRFWFGTKTGIELPGEYAGVVPTPAWLAENQPDQNWSVSATANYSIGQGYWQATPLQMALNASAVANGGTLWKPHLIKEIVDAQGKTVEATKRKKLRTIEFDKTHFDVVREGMRRTVHDANGSAHHVLDRNFQPVSKWLLTNPEGEEEIIIGGKTGTAEFGTIDERTGQYSNQHSWFICFAPFDDPEIALAVMIEDGGEGSSYAVPVADRVMRAYFELTGKRKRGKVLREDGQPIEVEDPDETSPAEGLPAPGETTTESQD